jgi:mannose-6-phosphate isomerase-like protein (cupin superfamily)/DNA-binding Xre family transcriptional regulator
MIKPKLVAIPPAKRVEPILGDCLRALRQRHRWSLSIVSARTGLATSTLSRVENNQLSLTYEKLMQLCRGLDIDLSELFAAGGPQPQAVVGRRSVTPPDGGRSFHFNRYLYRYLCTDLANKKMTPILGEITARTLEEAGGYLRHEGEELVYVLEGTLEFHSEHYAPLRVEAGGCVYFDSLMGHAFVMLGNKPVKFLSVCSAAEPELLKAKRSVNSNENG